MIGGKVVTLVFVSIAKWVSYRCEFDDLKVNEVLFNWEASLLGGYLNRRKMAYLVPPIQGVLKFNIDGAAGDKSGNAGIGVVLRNGDGNWEGDGFVF